MTPLPPRRAPPALARPVFHEMSAEDCRALLARNHVARLAFSFHDRVDIEPIHYVHDAGWIFGRTASGSKIRTIAHNRWIAFEVDEVDAFFDWRSVVVHGALCVMADEGTATERAAWRRGVELLQRLMPGALTPDDPTPDRQLLFRFRVDEVTGRSAATARGD